MPWLPTIPANIRRELAGIITRAIDRALKEQLGRLELEADRAPQAAEGLGKTGKGRDPAAQHFNRIGSNASANCARARP